MAIVPAQLGNTAGMMGVVGLAEIFFLYFYWSDVIMAEKPMAGCG